MEVEFKINRGHSVQNPSLMCVWSFLVFSNTGNNGPIFFLVNLISSSVTAYCMDQSKGT